MDPLILDKARRWGMVDQQNNVTPHAYQMASEWYQHVWEAGAYAIQVCMPFAMSPTDHGVLCIGSTAPSCIQDNQNQSISSTRPVTHPGWHLFEAWYFSGLVMHNITGMTITQTGGVRLGLAHEVFDRAWMDKSRHTRLNVNWRQMYLPRADEQYFDCLWRMLMDLDVKYWMVYTAGLSYKAYRGLDCYIRSYARDVTEPADEAWYILNTELPWYDRAWRQPQEWYLCHNWLSYGQRPVTANWILSGINALSRL